MVRRILIMAYGMFSYALFHITMLYAVGFIGGFLAPTHLDDSRRGSAAAALAVDLGLLILFALQHSGMARPAFKRWWTRLVPEPAERSTYVLFSCATLILLFWCWQPIGGVVWAIEDKSIRAIVYAIFAAGLLIVLGTSFLINHFDLFGLRQVWLHFHGRPYTHLRFTTPALYRIVRHPLYVGWLIAFWATPRMTIAHLAFASALTGYILIAIRWEERDLADVHPEYAAYREHVPMLIPRWPSSTGIPGTDSVTDRTPVMLSTDLVADQAS
jgi:protein-S-isoprenylcysteine O-methyltransferase Ste14